MLKLGVTEPAKMELAACIVLAAKKDGSQCYCVDFRKINAVSVQRSSSIPKMDTCIVSLGDGLIFFTINTNRGPCQVEIIDADRDKTDLFCIMGCTELQEFCSDKIRYISTNFGCNTITGGGAGGLSVSWREYYNLVNRRRTYIVNSFCSIPLTKNGVNLNIKMWRLLTEKIDPFGKIIRSGKLERADRTTDPICHSTARRIYTQCILSHGSCNLYQTFSQDLPT